MKKVIFTGLFLLVTSCLFAQDLKKAKSYYDKKELDKAKTEIDALLVKSPNDPQGLYLKSKIYGSIASTEQFKSLSPNARMEAFEAFKKAISVDKGNLLLIDLNKDQYKPIFDLYSGYYDAGIASFNLGAAGNKAEFENSYNNFVNANKVGSYIYSNKWALSELDTNLVLIIAKAALNAGNKEQTELYFKKLADAKVVATKDDNESYVLPYQWLTGYYYDLAVRDTVETVKKLHTDLLFKYAALGKQYFPKEDYFDAVLLDYYRDKKENTALFKKYEEMIVQFPDSMQYHFNYANDVFSYVYGQGEGKAVENKEGLLRVVGVELNKAVFLRPNDVNTNWLLGQYYLNMGIDVKEKALAIKGTKPEDVKAKADFNAQSKDIFNKAIPYTEKALKLLEDGGYKKSNKSKYKSIADLMQRIYRNLNQADKIKLYQDRYDKADALFIN